MAKRRRLTPANPMFLEPAPETKSAVAAPLRAPIADVAREASATAAAEELAQQMAQARASGRMVISVPLSQVKRDHLVRDRIAVDADEMAVLVESLRARGQQTPVELVDLWPATDGPRYGLISGWRRCMALEMLHKETGEARFAEVLGLLRRPTESAGAYVAMVEENEIRVGLSYYERARIVVRAVEAGAFPDEQAALRALFASASRAKRSKIGSFTTLVAELEGALRFPQALGERQGLTLAQALQAQPGLGGSLAGLLRAKRPESAEAEQALLRKAIAPKRPARKPATPGPVTIERRAPGEILLRADRLDDAFLADLEAWLAARTG